MSRTTGSIVDRMCAADFAHRMGFISGQLCALDWTHIDYVQNLVTLKVPGNKKTVTLSMKDVETLEPGFIILSGPRNESFSLGFDDKAPDKCPVEQCKYAGCCPKREA